MLLQNKNAVIYGAGGSIGGAVARAFAREGAKVFVTGRSRENIESVASDIIAAGGKAEFLQVDALDEAAVKTLFDEIVNRAGNIDISFNAIGLEDKQGTPVAEMKQEDFLRPIMTAMKTQFITSKVAAVHMIKNRSGVILSITASPAGKAYSLAGGFGPACSAMEGFSRNLAAELGPYGIRVLCLRSAGSPDSAVFIEAAKKQGTLAKVDVRDVEKDTMLGKLPLMADIGNVAAWMVSELAGGMTGTALNFTYGTTPD